MDKERILVVRKDILCKLGYFQGILTEDIERYYKEILRSYIFRDRSEVEEDPSFKQIIPYILLSYRDIDGDYFFLTKRRDDPSERRLSSRYSLGIGGHINDYDLEDTGDIIQKGMFRELAEEVELDFSDIVSSRLVGMINDDSDLVGKVHFGLVYKIETRNREVGVRSELEEGLFVKKDDLLDYYEGMERWSQLVYRRYITGE